MPRCSESACTWANASWRLRSGADPLPPSWRSSGRTGRTAWIRVRLRGGRNPTHEEHADELDERPDREDPPHADERDVRARDERCRSPSVTPRGVEKCTAV